MISNLFDLYFPLFQSYDNDFKTKELVWNHFVLNFWHFNLQQVPLLIQCKLKTRICFHSFGHYLHAHGLTCDSHVKFACKFFTVWPLNACWNKLLWVLFAMICVSIWQDVRHVFENKCPCSYLSNKHFSHQIINPTCHWIKLLTLPSLSSTDAVTTIIYWHCILKPW